jgi:hypothetical protein
MFGIARAQACVLLAACRSVRSACGRHTKRAMGKDQWLRVDLLVGLLYSEGGGPRKRHGLERPSRGHAWLGLLPFAPTSVRMGRAENKGEEGGGGHGRTRA